MGADMAESAVLKITKRKAAAAVNAAKLRETGMVPGVIYGHKQETLSISLSRDDLVAAIRHGSRVVDLQPEAAPRRRPRSLKCSGTIWVRTCCTSIFAASRPTNASIYGADRAPRHRPRRHRRRRSGSAVARPRNRCLAIHVPDSIRVNINELQLDAAIHVRDLMLPPDVKALADADAIVVHVTLPQAEPEAGAVERRRARPSRRSSAGASPPRKPRRGVIDPSVV